MQNEGGSFFDKLAGLFAGGAKRADENIGSHDNSAVKSSANSSDKQTADKSGNSAITANLNCCSGRVHIAYRGVSDDRLYLAENRTNKEVKFFRPIGLRVFCADCRKRLL